MSDFFLARAVADFAKNTIKPRMAPGSLTLCAEKQTLAKNRKVSFGEVQKNRATALALARELAAALRPSVAISVPPELDGNARRAVENKSVASGREDRGALGGQRERNLCALVRSQ